MAGRLEGKAALVLGAAGKDNMGQVIARRLVAEGARVLVAGRREAELSAFAAEIGGQYGLCDITRREDCLALAKSAVEELGGLDIAVNATGWGLVRPFARTSEDELRRMVDLQFVGPFLFFQAVLGVMSDGGSLMQISSATATIMLDDHAAYMGTKAGIDHVVRCLADEYGRRGIKVNSISPGITESPMTAKGKAIPGMWAAFEKKYPLGRTGTSADIAAAVTWLASDECFMTGENLQVNGGLTLRGNPSREEIAASITAATGKPWPPKRA